MNDTITTPNATLTPYALHTDRVRVPEIKENETGTLVVDFEPLQPLEHRLGTSLTFASTAQREAAQRIINDPPKTVGELWYDYLMLVAANANTVKNLNGLERGLGKVNAFLNEYAENENWCSEYEDKLSDMNSLLMGEGYNGWFQFEGRIEEVQVTIERRRVVLETVTVNMEKPKGSDLDYSDAVEQAADYDDELWDVQDDCYDTDYYEVVNVENVY